MAMESTFYKYIDLGLEGVPKSKSAKSAVSKTCIFCTKSTITRKFCYLLVKFDFIFEFSR